jgi:hypothetical protein
VKDLELESELALAIEGNEINLEAEELWPMLDEKYRTDVVVV